MIRENTRGFVPIILMIGVVAVAGVLLVTSISKFKTNSSEQVQGIETASNNNETPEPAKNSETAEPVETNRPREIDNETPEPKETEIPEASKPGEIELEKEGETTKLTTNGVSANTDFPLTLDKSTNQLFVDTGDGVKQIKILPSQASLIAQNSGIATQIDAVELVQNQNNSSSDSAVFKISGQKKGKLFGLIDISFPVTVSVGSQTGQVVGATQSFLLQLLSPLIK